MFVLRCQCYVNTAGELKCSVSTFFPEHVLMIISFTYIMKCGNLYIFSEAMLSIHLWPER